MSHLYWLECMANVAVSNWYRHNTERPSVVRSRAHNAAIAVKAPLTYARSVALCRGASVLFLAAKCVLSAVEYSRFHSFKWHEKCTVCVQVY